MSALLAALGGATLCYIVGGAAFLARDAWAHRRDPWPSAWPDRVHSGATMIAAALVAWPLLLGDDT